MERLRTCLLPLLRTHRVVVAAVVVVVVVVVGRASFVEEVVWQRRLKLWAIGRGLLWLLGVFI